MVREWRSTELFTAYTTARGPVPLQPCPLIPHHEDATSGEESWPIFATDFSDRFFLQIFLARFLGLAPNFGLADFLADFWADFRWRAFRSRGVPSKKNWLKNWPGPKT